jgi:hypothetical protein
MFVAFGMRGHVGVFLLLTQSEVSWLSFGLGKACGH